MRQRIPALALPVLLAVAAGLSGCVTIMDESTQMQQREDMLLLQEKLSKLEGRVETVEMEVERMQGGVDSLRSQAAGQGEVRTIQSRLDQLEAGLRTVEAAREKDRQEIIDKLSAQIAKIVRPSSSGTARRQTTRSASETGYEHVVQSGETLSEIASAYGVTIKAILDNNEIGDPNRLRVGQKLFIPE